MLNSKLKCAKYFSPTPQEFLAYCLGSGLTNMMQFVSMCDFPHPQNAYCCN